MNLPPPVILLDPALTAELLDLPTCIAAVDAAFVAHARGGSLSPGLLHVEAPHGEFHVKAGGLRGDRNWFACKINGGFPENQIKHGLPSIVGIIVLSDASTGAPLAILESGHITRLRTGAATAVAARRLARPESAVATICGSGAQAEVQLRALLEVLPIRRVHVWGGSNAAAFCRRMSAACEIDVLPAGELHEATLQSDVIVTCTPARRWFLGREHVRPGVFIAAVGADGSSKQEIEPELVAAAHVVCDLVSQSAAAGDMRHAIAAGLMRADDAHAELGDVLAGKAPGRESAEDIFLFDSTGTALQDVAAAAAVYERWMSTAR